MLAIYNIVTSAGDKSKGLPHNELDLCDNRMPLHQLQCMCSIDFIFTEYTGRPRKEGRFYNISSYVCIIAPQVLLLHLSIIILCNTTYETTSGFILFYRCRVIRFLCYSLLVWSFLFIVCWRIHSEFFGFHAPSTRSWNGLRNTSIYSSSRSPCWYVNLSYICWSCT